MCTQHGSSLTSTSGRAGSFHLWSSFSSAFIIDPEDEHRKKILSHVSTMDQRNQPCAVGSNMIY